MKGILTITLAIASVVANSQTWKPSYIESYTTYSKTEWVEGWEYDYRYDAYVYAVPKNVTGFLRLMRESESILNYYNFTSENIIYNNTINILPEDDDNSIYQKVTQDMGLIDAQWNYANWFFKVNIKPDASWMLIFRKTE